MGLVGDTVTAMAQIKQAGSEPGASDPSSLSQMLTGILRNFASPNNLS